MMVFIGINNCKIVLVDWYMIIMTSFSSKDCWIHLFLHTSHSRNTKQPPPKSPSSCFPTTDIWNACGTWSSLWPPSMLRSSSPTTLPSTGRVMMSRTSLWWSRMTSTALKVSNYQFLNTFNWTKNNLWSAELLFNCLKNGKHSHHTFTEKQNLPSKEKYGIFSISGGNAPAGDRDKRRFSIISVLVELIFVMGKIYDLPDAPCGHSGSADIWVADCSKEIFNGLMQGNGIKTLFWRKNLSTTFGKIQTIRSIRRKISILCFLF